MSVHIRSGGVWTEFTGKPYLKVAGTWVDVNEIHTRRSGTWQQAFLYDVIPPDSPVITIEKVITDYTQDSKSKHGRHIKIGVKMPGVVNNTQIKRIRVLVSSTQQPATQYETSTYISNSDDDWPDEPWSEYEYNGFGGSSLNRNTSNEFYKQWTRNPTAETIIEGGKTYYFSAWSEDFSGNWSAGVFASIFIEKNFTDTDQISKEARFKANGAGSWKSDAFTAGSPTQASTPRSRGLFFYGAQLANNVGTAGPAAIKSAQIMLHRKNDTGKDQANVYLFWHAYGNNGDIGASLNQNESTKLGTIAKGETKWFKIPETMWPNIVNKTLKGFGLDSKDPASDGAVDKDYSQMKSVADAVRTGEVHLTWVEKP